MAKKRGRPRAPFGTKQNAIRQAKDFRKYSPHAAKTHTVNVKLLAPDYWGIRFSLKGKRDKFNWEKAR